MRTINRIVIHCSATRSNIDFTAKQVDTAHKAKGFRCWGYHYYIRKSGEIERMRPLEMVGAHAKGYNQNSVGICYEGGLDRNGVPSDTRTVEQKEMLDLLVKQLCAKYPIKSINGHRDLSPDLDGDGMVEPEEWVKICPCFEVKGEYD